MTRTRTRTPTAADYRSGPAIDWGAVHAQLERLGRAAEAALNPTPEAARAVLEARARALACVPVVAPDPAAVLNIVTFTMGGEPYAIEIRFVRRVIRFAGVSLTTIPGTPDVLAGVINMEGEILAIFDFGRLLGLARASTSERSRILVLGTDDNELGLLADAAEEVRPLRIDAVLEPPCALEEVGRGILRGVTAEALIVLDGAALLRDPRLIIDQGDEGTA
jgi:purine-binding chemotaxis protein CheW